MINQFRRRNKLLSIVFIVLFGAQLLEPVGAYALTSGPSQPEVQSFTPATASEMVDLFTGDFSYNIPLFELPGPNGGYPFNLFYKAGITMDQEASWVGLGWNLNPGAITRQMRGLPDEFKGDLIHTKMSIKPSVTVGLNAGAGLEIFGADKNTAKPTLKLGFSVMQNSYTGLGYSIDGNFGFGKTVGGMTSGISLGVSLNPKEGISVNPSLSLGSKVGEFGLSAGYHSKEGLSNISASHSGSLDFVDTRAEMDSQVDGIGVSSSLSLAHPSYTPQITMPMRSVNINAQFKAGAAGWGVFVSPYISGFYSEQWLHDNKRRVPTEAYGYLHYGEVDKSRVLQDITREKDGMVTQDSPNLPMPSLSYDIYSAAGQGISAMYRPMRNDFGIVHDAETISKSTTAGVGVDIGVFTHAGVNLNLNHARSVSGKWNKNDNQLLSSLQYQKTITDNDFEPWYFKVHGEPSSAVIQETSGDQAIRVKLNGQLGNYITKASDILENRTQSFPASALSNNQNRKSRTQVIQPITNGGLIKGGQELISQFKIEYVNALNVNSVLDRSSFPEHHIAGFTALTPEGLRYNYGLPAYNIYQEEVSFSTQKQPGDVSRVNVNGTGDDPEYNYPNTDEFLKRTELPSYTHSHLLTSILGPDYVDVTGDGVTADDLGYWVKFTYKKTTTDTDHYKWRDPFLKAHYEEGWVTDPRDDKGSFTYGEKEMWYLSKAETKSHIAVFSLLERNDAKGAGSKLQDVDSKGQSSYALNEIKLFTRFGGETVPIKIVRFEYDYSLCKGVYNNILSNEGKLTLKKVWFEYGGSQRGRFNPYVFNYHSNNPTYNILAYDRWGVYKPNPDSQPYFNHDFPYSEQNPELKEIVDNNAAAWSLSEIKLPSGGKILVDYESDDYGYVQHKPAMQMTEMVNPHGDPEQEEFQIDYDDTKVKFRLKKSISGNLTTDEQEKEVLKYLDQSRGQLYFKIKINLRSSEENFHEFVSGYADIDFDQAMGLEGNGLQYQYGYFHLKKEDGLHPFSLRAFQHIRTNQPDLANSTRVLRQTNNNGERVNQIKSLMSVAAQVRQMFEGFNNFCKKSDWGKELIAGKSWIRLQTPDLVKNGGGLRVKQITITDQWAHDEEGIYGQLYEYSMVEDGSQISSGVASYEPFIGGDENSLRYAKKFTQSVPLRSNNNLFFEYPINESYYPGPQVGYRKVTVMSLATAHRMGKAINHVLLSDGKKLFPEDGNVKFGSSGFTLHEFYTAKDFPVITDETEKDDKPFRMAIPIPYIGSISISKLTTSQGYSIVTNDMHGKIKKVSNYRQDDNGNPEHEPISWVKYNYLSEQRIYQSERVNTLTNTFVENEDGSLSKAATDDLHNGELKKFTIGQENEFIVDMREFDDDAMGGGARLNVDVLFFFIGAVPVPAAWPTISRSLTQLRTVVTNKVIFKSGILDNVEAYDGGSRIVTHNLKWDKLTGAPILTSVSNNFDAPVFSYNIPAYTHYDGMGPAYKNIGLSFSVLNLRKDPYKDTRYTFATIIDKSKMFPGDELLLYPVDGNSTEPIGEAIYEGIVDDDHTLFCETPLTPGDYKALVVRSGFRNQLSVSAGSITALQDPTIGGTKVTHSKTISVPKF